MATYLLHILYVATDRHALSQLLLLHAYDTISRSEARRPAVSVCIVIVERLADGILGVKHGVAAFVIQFLECYYKNAATCCCRPLSSGRWNISSTQ